MENDDEETNYSNSLSMPTAMPINTGDLSLIQHLSEELISSGVLADEEVLGPRITSQESLDSMMKEAQAGARYENEVNPEFYHAEVEALVSQREQENMDWLNPSLDGRDDYDEQIYEGNLVNPHREVLPQDTIEDDFDKMIDNYE